jgi:hypothetical protein
MVLDDEEGELNLTPVQDRPIQESIFHDKLVMSATLEDDDDDLTTFLISSQSSRLSGLNMLNVATYVVHLFVSYGVGVWGLDGLVSTRVEVAQEYDTLVTPASWAYYIWIPILVTETVFVVAQLFPEYRTRPIIQQGISFWFFYTCLLMTGWTLFFCFRLFIISFICVILSVISLASLLASCHLSQLRGHKSTEEFWLFLFPFLLHFGWMVVMAAVHFAQIMRYVSNHHLATQLAADMVAIGLLLPVACFFLLQTDGHNFIIPAVILWSYVGMAWRLQNPDQELLDDYGDMAVSAIRQVVYFFFIVIACLLGPRLFVWIANTYFTIRVLRLSGDEDDGGQMSRSSYWNLHIT